MSANKNTMPAVWADEDDAPDMTEYDDLQGGEWRIGGKLVPAEEGQAALREMLGKKQVNMMLDRAVIAYFKAKAGGRGYQTLINETLKQAIEREQLEDALRRIIREELRAELHQ